LMTDGQSLKNLQTGSGKRYSHQDALAIPAIIAINLYVRQKDLRYYIKTFIHFIRMAPLNKEHASFGKVLPVVEGRAWGRPAEHLRSSQR